MGQWSGLEESQWPALFLFGGLLLLRAVTASDPYLPINWTISDGHHYPGSPGLFRHPTFLHEDAGAEVEWWGWSGREEPDELRPYLCDQESGGSLETHLALSRLFCFYTHNSPYLGQAFLPQTPTASLLTLALILPQTPSPSFYQPALPPPSPTAGVVWPRPLWDHSGVCGPAPPGGQDSSCLLLLDRQSCAQSSTYLDSSSSSLTAYCTDETSTPIPCTPSYLNSSSNVCHQVLKSASCLALTQPLSPSPSLHCNLTLVNLTLPPSPLLIRQQFRLLLRPPTQTPHKGYRLGQPLMLMPDNSSTRCGHPSCPVTLGSVGECSEREVKVGVGLWRSCLLPVSPGLSCSLLGQLLERTQTSLAASLVTVSGDGGAGVQLPLLWEESGWNETDSPGRCPLPTHLRLTILFTAQPADDSFTVTGLRARLEAGLDAPSQLDGGGRVQLSASVQWLEALQAGPSSRWWTQAARPGSGSWLAAFLWDTPPFHPPPHPLSLLALPVIFLALLPLSPFL